MKQFILFSFLLCAATKLMAQKAFDGVKSPELKISQWIDSQPVSLVGKTIILEFWATWCGGCIEAIPHLNEMEKKYGSDSLLFISVNSYDKKEKIVKFLEKTPIAGLVAMDDDKKTIQNFKVTQMPQTFLIDKNGYLRWHGVPGLLTDEFMQAFIKEYKILIPEIGNPLFYSLKISFTKDRSTSSVSFIDGEKPGLFWKNRGLTDIINQSYLFAGLKKHQFRFTGKIPLEPSLDVEIRADTSLSEGFIYNDLVQRLAAMFDFKVIETKEKKEIWHLSVLNNNLFEKAKSQNQSENIKVNENGNEIQLRNVETWQLADILKTYFEGIFLSDLSSGEQYDIDLPIESIEQLQSSLANKYGLKLEMKIEEIDVRVVEFKLA